MAIYANFARHALAQQSPKMFCLEADAELNSSFNVHFTVLIEFVLFARASDRRDKLPRRFTWPYESLRSVGGVSIDWL